MAIVNTHKAKSAKIINFGRQRFFELKNQIQSCQEEIIMWEEIIAAQQPCPQCDGIGHVNLPRPDGDGTYHPNCSTCNGEGTIK